MTEGHPAVVESVANSGRQRDLGRENVVLRELVTVYRQLSGLALQDAGLASVAQLIADRTAATVAVVSPLMDVLAAASPGVPADKAAELIGEAVAGPRLAQVLRASREGHRPLWLPSVGGMPPVIVAPVRVGDEVPAHLITMDPAAGPDPAEDVRLLVTEHAATICGVILGRQNVVAAAARRVRDDLVEGLLLGRGRDDGETGRWAAHLGYDPGREHHVLAIAFDVPPPRPGLDPAALRQRVCDVIEHFFTTRAPDVILSVREAEVVLVTAAAAAQADGRDARRLASTCLARLAELFPDTRAIIGIGGPCRDPREIARSYQEAHRTLETLRRLGQAGTVTAFGDLGIYRLLLQVPDLAELRSFADDVLGALTQADRDRHADYLATLACYLRENSSPQRAARFLHVHPNTVAYRVRRIEEITGLSLDSYRDRLSSQVALEILEALGVMGDGP
jgi:PucR family transcriptional regulator, purine catabolism regulatory protein